MKLEHSFDVEAPLERVWARLIDIEQVAPCLPGAEVTESSEKGVYEGNFTIKLGPTTAAYAGKLQLTEVDEHEPPGDDERQRARQARAGLGQGDDLELDERGRRRPPTSTWSPTSRSPGAWRASGAAG